MWLLAMALNSIAGSCKKNHADENLWKTLNDFFLVYFSARVNCQVRERKTTNGSLVTHCYLPSPNSYPNSPFYFHLLCGGTLPVPAQKASRITQGPLEKTRFLQGHLGLEVLHHLLIYSADRIPGLIMNSTSRSHSPMKAWHAPKLC